MEWLTNITWQRLSEVFTQNLLHTKLKSQKILAKSMVVWPLKDLSKENLQGDYSPIKVIDAFSKRRNM